MVFLGPTGHPTLRISDLNCPWVLPLVAASNVESVASRYTREGIPTSVPMSCPEIASGSHEHPNIHGEAVIIKVQLTFGILRVRGRNTIQIGTWYLERSRLQLRIQTSVFKGSKPLARESSQLQMGKHI
ncbi:hypothetical protein PAAG_03605 [Paracoccidioides lutzii Pb01]|uniref:Uncharacterized protein n=1 Tax=Paracoccidioides lutzii (strain ATCC MYA-826 / Pb01) TaxID=502779 RepID=C1GXN1_PARBA|nr:hypothetical protein PAAG_03605 [Paracoccidioides lutzii Pb01]EEH41319.2 hypothetical protein PAAG_03605 [Paracoccidioides lutzii Pb01]